MSLASTLKYPLAQVLDVKRRRVEEAEKVVAQKKKQLEQEKEKLLRVEQERDKVLAHYQDKLQQLRDTLSDIALGERIQQMRVYLQVVEEKLKVEQEKVRQQQAAVVQAEKELENAQAAWRQAMKEVDKLDEHRKIWFKEQLIELERQEAKEQDEVGSLIHLSRKRREDG